MKTMEASTSGPSTTRHLKDPGEARRAGVTPLAVRTTGIDIEPDLRDYVRERMGFKLGKFGRHIERVTVRFADENGPRGGLDSVCRIKVVLIDLPSTVVEDIATKPREAFDRAGDSVERAVRRALIRARKSASGSGRARAAKKAPLPGAPPEARRSKRRPLLPPEDGSLIGRRVGRAADNLARAADRPEKRRRDFPVDTSLPGWSATDRRAGGSSTAARNTKRNTAKMTSALEDSATDSPSRKSTRKSANRSKTDGNLRRRQMSRLSSPRSRATKGS